MTHEIDSEKRTRSVDQHDQSPRHVANQLVVKLKTEFAANQTARHEVINSLPEESKMIRDFDESGLAVFELPKEADPSAVARAVETHPLVDYAEPNYIDKGNEP